MKLPTLKELFFLIGFLSTTASLIAQKTPIELAKKSLSTDYNKSISYLKESTTIYLDTFRVFNINNFPPTILELHDRLNDNVLESNYWESIIKEVKLSTQNPYILASCYIRCSKFNRRIGAYTTYKASTDSAISYAKKSQSKALLAEAYFERATFLRIGANYELARTYLKKTIDLSKDDPYTAANIYAIMELGRFKHFKLEKDSTFYYLNLALKYAKKGKLNTLIGTAYTRIADNFLSLQSYDSAMYYINLAIRIRRADGGYQNLANSQLIKANVLLEKNNFKESLLLYDSVIDNYLIVKNKKGYLNALVGKANVYFRSGESDEAITLFTAASEKLKEAEMSNSRITFAANSLETIQQLPADQVTKRIKQYYDTTLAILQSAERQEILLADSLSLLKALSWKYKVEGNYEEAISYMDSYTRLLEKKYNIETSDKLKEVATELMLSERSVELERAKVLAAKLAQSNSKNKIYLLFSIFILLLVLAILIIARTKAKAKIAKQELEKLLDAEKVEKAQLKINLMAKQLDLNKKELTTYTLETIERNNLLADIKKRLSKAKISQGEVNKINKQLNIQSGIKKDWEEFKVRFNQVDESFVKKMKSLFPDLNESDIRLASLIKLGFSSKQIAEFLNNSPASVDVARSRLRKKMGLTPKDNLKNAIRKVN